MLAVASSKETLTCFVCGNRLCRPRILPCLHTFCTDCILSLQTYPIISQMDHSDVADSEVDLFPTRDNDCCPSANIIQPPKEFDSSEYPWITPPRSRNNQRKVNMKVTRSKSCSDKLGIQESEHRRSRSLNRDSNNSSRDSKEGNIVVRSRREFYNNRVTPTESPILLDKKRIIMCPVCWKEVQVSTTLQELPRNLLVERYLTQDVARSSRAVLNCDLCNDICNTHDDDNDEIARSNVTVRCLDCYENMCSLCETAHRRQKKTSTHTLVRLDHLQNVDSKGIPACVTSECVSNFLPASETSVLPKVREGTESSNMFNLPSLLTFDHFVSKESQTKFVISEKSVTGQHSETNGISQRSQNLLIDRVENIQQSSSINIADFRDVSANLADFRDVSANLADFRDVSANLAAGEGRTAKCLEHIGEDLKMFCVTCEVNVCLDCVILRHRSHDCQFVTRELFQNQMDDVDRLIQAIIPKVGAFDDQIKTLSQMKNWTMERSNAVSDEVNAFMDSFIEAVEIHRKQLLEQVTSLYESKDKVLSLAQEHLLHARADVEQTCRFLGQLLTSATDVEILSLKRLLVDRLTSVRDVSFRPHFPEHDYLRFCPTMTGEVINNFQMFGRVITNQPSAFHSVLHGDGLNTARLERKCLMVLNVFDCEGLPYNDNDVTIDARIYFQGKEINVPVNIVHLTGGAHQISFTPGYEGTHFLHVGVNGCSIQDSPFKFHVKAKWRRHAGTWATSTHGFGTADHLFGCDISTEGGRTLCQSEGHYWTCCGKMTYNSECLSGRARNSPVHQATF